MALVNVVETCPQGLCVRDIDVTLVLGLAPHHKVERRRILFRIKH